MVTGAAGLIWILVFGYLFLAIVAFFYAVRTPSNLLVKAVLGAAVLALFGYPFIRQKMDSDDNKELLSRIERSCHEKSDVELVEKPSKTHISKSALINSVYLGDAASYLLERGLTELEIDANPDAIKYDQEGEPNYRTHHYQTMANSYDIGIPQVFSFSIADKRNSNCAAFKHWVSEYPAQRIPPLRYLGLKPGKCVAVSVKDQPESALSISASARKVWAKLPRASPDEFEFAITKRSTGTQVAHAKAILFGNRDACNVKDNHSNPLRGLTLDQLLPIVEHLAPTKITVDDPPMFLEQRDATEDDLLKTSSIRGVGRDWSTNNIDPEGLAWIENKYIATDHRGSFSHDGYYLTVVTQDQIKRTLVTGGNVAVHDITGILIRESDIRVVGEDRERTRHWLLIFDRTGTPVSSLKLRLGQFNSLKSEIKQ